MTTNSSLSVLEPGDSGSTTTGIEVCLMLDSTPGEIDRDIGVTLNTNAATAGQFTVIIHIIYYAHHQASPLPYKAKHVLTAAKVPQM